MTTLDDAALAGMRRVRRDPAAFFRDWLGIDPWEKQIAIAESVRDHRRTAVKSCHASGKSYISARVIIWYLHAYPGSVVITTAPTQNQVKNILWREINAAYRGAARALLGRCLTLGIDIAPDWYALGFKADDTAADRFQGFHSERALVVIDEAAGVDDRVFEALNAALTSEHARLLLIGNPTSVSGRFYEAFHGARDLYHCITIAASDTPNIQTGRTIRPYLITQQWINDAVAEHGADSPYVLARVAAEFPGMGSDRLIPLAWIEAAHHRTPEAEPADADAFEAGLDVARTGEDENALCLRHGPQVVAEHTWSGIDTMQTVGKVRELLDGYPPLGKLKVDVIGVGAGVADRLKELGYPVVEVNVSAAPSNSEDFLNLRCEFWWNVRERFREGGICGPIAERTQAQLADIKFSYDSRHKKPVIEKKEDAKRRGIKSPDRADALMLAFTNHRPKDAQWQALLGRVRPCPACGKTTLVEVRRGQWTCGACRHTHTATASA